MRTMVKLPADAMRENAAAAMETGPTIVAVRWPSLRSIHVASGAVVPMSMAGTSMKPVRVADAPSPYPVPIGCWICIGTATSMALMQKPAITISCCCEDRVVGQEADVDQRITDPQFG